jgi:hypothetical protein
MPPPIHVNKYLQHIIRKTNKAGSLAACVSEIQAKKHQAVKTYLFLVQKRMKL